MGGKKQKIPLLLRIIPAVFPVVEKIAPPLAYRFFVYLFFKPLRYRLPEKEIEMAATAEKFVEIIGGKRVQCYFWGDQSAPTVILVHGWAGRAMQFRKFIKPINDAGYRAVAFDAPAHGLSQGNKTEINEFQQAIQHVHDKVGNVKAIITHSFGGGATLYAMTKGLPVRILINIASPTIGDEIINTYLRAINGSQKTGQHFRKYVKQLTGNSFDDYTAMGFVRQIPADLRLLLIYDEDDKESAVDHAYALKKEFPSAELMITRGNGHTRILKDEAVIERTVTFINNQASG